MTASYLPITMIPYETFQKDENTIQLSRTLANYFQILSFSTVFLKFGIKWIEVKIHLADLPKNELHVSKSLISQFKIPIHEAKYLAQYNQSTNTLLVGPIIALMTEISETNEEPNFRSVHTFCEELHFYTQKLGGLFYVFNSYNFSTDEISGYYYGDDGWIKHIFPQPDVVYNRIHSRKLERSKFFLKIKNQFQDRNIPFFNDRFLSKWDIHEILLREDFLHPHLPETLLYSETNFKNLLLRHSHLFLKPIHGSQGRNILHLYKENQSFIVKISTGSQSDDFISFSNVEKFFIWFARYRKKTIYIVQQGIPLLLYKNRHIDFRVLCHKNVQNAWKVTSVVARISGEKQFVANISRGGETLKPLKALTELFERKLAFELFSYMKELAKEISTVISDNASGLTGELGLDIGIDSDGKLWLIEANSKPSKNFEEKEVKVRPSTKAIIELCTALAFEYKNKEMEENIHADSWIHDSQSSE